MSNLLSARHKPRLLLPTRSTSPQRAPPRVWWPTQRSFSPLCGGCAQAKSLTRWRVHRRPSAQSRRGSVLSALTTSPPPLRASLRLAPPYERLPMRHFTPSSSVRPSRCLLSVTHHIPLRLHDRPPSLPLPPHTLPHTPFPFSRSSGLRCSVHNTGGGLALNNSSGRRSARRHTHGARASAVPLL